jgi:hypothetical protein
MITLADSYVSRVLFASPFPRLRRERWAMAPAYQLAFRSVSA